MDSFDANDILRHLAQVTSTMTGEDFFYSLVREIATTLHVNDVLIAERPDLKEPLVRTLACWTGDKLIPNFEYALPDADSCYANLQLQTFVQLDGASVISAQHARLHGNYYIEIPLIGSQQCAVGHLGVMDEHPINPELIPILQIFAARASAEVERSRARHEHLVLEDRYRQLFDNSPQPILVFNAETLFYTDVNEAACRLYGYSRAEFLSITTLQLRPNSEAERLREVLRESIETQRPISGRWKHLRKDSSVLDVECNCVIFKVGGQFHVMSLITDISERQRAEEQRQNAALEERNRLARELHDSVNQTLWSAALIADVLPELWEQDVQNGYRKLNQLRQLNRMALAEMRALLLELRPASVLEASMGDLLRRLIDALFPPTRITVVMDVAQEYPMLPDLKVAFYRIAQEALNNIVRHAEANLVRVALGHSGDSLQLLISDDGRGFDPALPTTGHMGLHIMRERAEAVGAALTIRTTLEQGTEICVVWQEKNRKS